MTSCKWILLSLLPMLAHISLSSATELNSRSKRAPPFGEHAVPGNVSPLLPLVNAGNPARNAEPVADKPPQNADKVKAKKKEHIKIADSPECAGEVKRFCSDRTNSNNFLVLDCLQDDEKTASKLSEECHHFLWTFKLNLTRDSRFEDASSETCSQELDAFQDCKRLDQGNVIPCLIEHYEEIKTKPCRVFLNKMASIIFSEHRLMSFFFRDCSGDIDFLKCGRVEPLDSADDSQHSQGQTVTCLNKNRKMVSKACKKSLLRVAELQADDFHLDRPLYYACKGDREYLCRDVVAGEGAVFKCLYNHLGDPKLSDSCRARLEERQQLIAEDVKADKAFYDACKEDIATHKCAAGGNSAEGDLSRASVLLCLETAHSLQRNVKAECLQEIFELRSQLMQDYKVNPELVSACESEIENFCSLKHNDNVLQCLMKEISQRSRNADEDNRFSSECKAEVTKLVKVINPGENIQLDQPLLHACEDIISQACSDFHAGQGDIITCLLENLDHDDMTDECEDQLLVIQYFAARDFSLDFHLFKECRADAVSLCHSDGFNDPASMTPDQGPLIFSCLHRHLRSENPKDKKPSPQCIHEIRRVMRERSVRVNLMPEVEAACIEDLSSHCSDDDEHKKVNGEMECLQSILEDLTPKCKAVVANFTKEEFEDLEIDRILTKSCKPMMKLFCGDLLNSDAIPDEVLNCLIENKNHNDMNEKCAASIEHHQIISLKDYRFSVKFREACQVSVNKHCKNMQKKSEIIVCLSRIVRDDTLKEETQRIDERCRRQIKFELLQRGETIELDRELKEMCKADIEDLCPNKKKGEGEILECLRAHRKRLSNSCHHVVFQRQKDAALFGDYTLLHICKKMIKMYCSIDADEADILKCLKENEKEDNFDDRCRQVIHHRQIEQAQDFKLDPHLHKACRLDIPKFCSHLLKDGASDDREMEGQVIDCLKRKYASKTKILSRDCENEIQSRIKEAAVDINLNPVIIKNCKEDIKRLCSDKFASVQGSDVENGEVYKAFGSGQILECLKKNVKDLKNPKCKEEVALVIVESGVDVQVDPLLNSACQQDLIIHCKDVPNGQGRQMSCLLSYLESDPNSLTRNCKEMLQRRKDLWEYAAMVVPAESFSEILDQMTSSPARNYFFAILFTVVGIIFLVGLTCGRVTKRVREEIKNK